ncbi:hypothetical protein ATE67_17015 [Sphingopyxis sp. H050]|jgi:LacI family transcriptional regulator|nr:substrate-binding domain-containing protein [Sphingopyxis sp. H050]KTE18796.1 hypothetical protein ATE67_17015 [Sphingopyxis sp. H050]
MQAGVGQRCREANFRMIVQPCDVNSPGLIDGIGALIDQAQLDGTDLTATSAVYIDNVQAADDMTAYLISLGHRRIGLVAGHANYFASGQRLTGYRQALQRAGIGSDAALVRPGQFDFQSGAAAAAAAALLALPKPPTSSPRRTALACRFPTSCRSRASTTQTLHRRSDRR